MAAGLSVIRQDDFSAGAFPNSTAERIPRNGFWSSSNMLVDDVGALYKRGGSTLLAGTSSPASQIVWVWQGTLTGGSRTLAATTTTLYSVSGGTFTSLGALTTMANGANRPAVLGGVMYLPPASGVNTVTYDGTTVGTLSTNTFFYNTSVANRLVFAGGLFPSQVSFSGIGTTTFGAADLWKIPGGAVITGLASLRDSAVVFTDQGTWVISNMALNLTDTAGNVQQRLDLYSPDLALWGTGAAGVVGYGSGLIVPARDGVWLMRIGATSEVPPLELLSRPVTERYRYYVAAGYRPGLAAVFRGHYFLPILNGTTLVDFFVCRLDARERPWTFLDITVMAAALASSQDGRSLVGGMKLTSGASKLATLYYLDPGSATTDYNASVPTCNVFARKFYTGSLNENTVVRGRVAYRLSDAASVNPTMDVNCPAVGGAGTTFPESGNLGSDTVGTGTFRVGKRGRSMDVLVTEAADAAEFRLFSVELFVRSSGRQ